MIRFSRLSFALLLLTVCGCARADPTPAQTSVKALPHASTPIGELTGIPVAFDDYMERVEPHYKWEKEDEKTTAQNSVTTLKVVSQEWQGNDWTHRVEIIRPKKIDFPQTALVLVSYGSPQELLIAELFASQIGAVVVNVNNVPNQPLFEKHEDALIAYTFQKYMETGDASWPLLLPMTKSVIAAMNAAQEYSSQNKTPIKNFIVGGASKRGWTSWLVAAADAKLHPGRISGIIPIVYNNLNIPKQLPHQLESWGKYSEMIGDYTKLGLQDQTSTSRGALLVMIVDPYTYRARFTMPKLLINGANDRYWTPDATQFYLNDLPGSTSLYFAPNAGHDLASDYPNVLGTASAWFRLVAVGGRLPIVELKYPRHLHNNIRGYRYLDLTTNSPEQILRIHFWIAHSATRDFRDAKWETMYEGTESNDHYVAGFPPSPKGTKYSAVFGEIIFKGKGVPLRLSTPMEIWKSEKPIKQ